jgi:hypothetical protein
LFSSLSAAHAPTAFVCFLRNAFSNHSNSSRFQARTVPANDTKEIPLREAQAKDTMGSNSAAAANEVSPGMKAYMGPSLFQPHFARRAIRDAHEKKIPPLVGYYAGLSSVPLTRFLAPLGYDMVWIDWEHTPCGVETMTTVGYTSFLLLWRSDGVLLTARVDGPRNHVHERRPHDSLRQVRSC